MSETNFFSPLEHAYINFDQIRPIEPNGEDAKFHIDLNAKSVKRLLLDLKLQARQNLKILFSGHKGCGKSTQINYLAATPEINADFLVVKYSIQDLLNPDDLDHIDLLVSMALKAYEAAQEAGIPASAQLQKKVYLILIDDTDKSPLDKSLQVFEQNGLHLAKPKCCVVYVIDMALVCTGRFRATEAAIGKATILPNLRLTNVAGEIDEEAETNRALLKQIASSRMDSNLIDDDVLNEVTRLYPK